MLMQRPLLLAAMIPCALALTACANSPRLVLPPADLATCAGEPVAPALPDRDGTNERARDMMTLDYILSLRSAWADCAAKVAGLDAWIKEAR
jgi:hypothetical protein